MTSGTVADGASRSAETDASQLAAVDSSPSVLVAGGPGSVSRMESWLEPLLPVMAATSRSGVLEAMDRDVCVLVLGPGISTDTKEVLLQTFSLRCPFGRSLVVPADDHPPMIEGPGYDSCCYRPLERERVRSAVKQLARVSIYQRTLAQYFECTTIAANLDVGREGDRLAEDVDGDALQERVHRLKARLARMRASMDEEDMNLVLETAEDRGMPPTGDTVERTNAKRRPDACTDCDLEWGVNHGGSLGLGCERLGAFVWKCQRCGTVQEAPDPSHRRVA